MKPIRDDEKGQNFIRGSHITFQNIEMFFTTLKQIGQYAVYLFLALVAIYLWLVVAKQDFYFFYKYEMAHLFSTFGGLKGTTLITYENKGWGI